MRFFASIVLSAALLWPTLGSAAAPEDLDEVVRLACEENMSTAAFGENHRREWCRMEFAHGGTWYQVDYWSERWERTIYVHRDGQPTRVVDVDRYLTFTTIELWQFDADGQWPMRERYMAAHAFTGEAMSGTVNLGMEGPALMSYEMSNISERYSAEESSLRYKALWQARLDEAVRTTLQARGRSSPLSY